VRKYFAIDDSNEYSHVYSIGYSNVYCIELWFDLTICYGDEHSVIDVVG